MPRHRAQALIGALGLLALAPSLLVAQADTTGRWTVDDILMPEGAGQFAVAPDGGRVAWIKTTWEKEKGRVGNLMLSGLTGTREIALTRGAFITSAPAWSPDGRRIAFLSSRPLPEPKPDAAGTQLWLIDPEGGEPWPLTSFERGIQEFHWRDSSTILFTAQEDPGNVERRRKKDKDDSRVVDDSLHEPPVRLFSLAVETRKTTRLSDNDDWISSLAVSKDGRHAVTVHDRELSFGFDQRTPPTTWLWDLASGERRQLFAGSRAAVVNVAWAEDGAGFYFITDSTRHPRWRTATILLVAYYDLETRRTTLVDREWERGALFSLLPTPDGVIVPLADGVHGKPARYTRSGDIWHREWLTGPHLPNVDGLAVADDARRVVYQYSTASQPGQWYRARLDGATLSDTSRLTTLNAGYEGKPKPRTEVVHWKGARNETVEGLLYYPIGYVEGRRYPLIMSIHGGPAGHDADSWSQSWAYPNVLLNQAGAFLLKPNYHGSNAYGLDWVESIGEGRYYDLELPDIQRGIEYLVGRGLADTSRLATMGWSNGSILSIELTTREPRLKAAVVGAGDVEWFSDWGNVDFGMAFDNYYFGKAPYEDPQLYIRKSPFFRLDRVRSPMLVFHGTEDRNVPTAQSWDLYRALQQIGKTEVRFVLFPGEPHGLQQLAHQRRKVTEELAWFDRFLFHPTPSPSAERAALLTEAYDSSAPLGELIRQRNFPRVGSRYGVETNGVLTPEVVSVRREGKPPLLLGRFEVTTAQWAAFDSASVVDPGKENYPQGGISLQRAQAYVIWLSQRTGARWRLPGIDEVKSLFDGAGKGGNTLDFWAGYTLNPDDAERIGIRVGELVGRAPLLKPVGSFPGFGSPPVYDLAGNVAEWVVGPEGAGVLLGGSADRPADPRSDRGATGEAYRGVRVVKEE